MGFRAAAWLSSLIVSCAMRFGPEAMDLRGGFGYNALYESYVTCVNAHERKAPLLTIMVSPHDRTYRCNVDKVKCRLFRSHSFLMYSISLNENDSARISESMKIYIGFIFKDRDDQAYSRRYFS
jgi:hypothetical protein